MDWDFNNQQRYPYDPLNVIYIRNSSNKARFYDNPMPPVYAMTPKYYNPQLNRYLNDDVVSQTNVPYVLSQRLGNLSYPSPTIRYNYMSNNGLPSINNIFGPNRPEEILRQYDNPLTIENIAREKNFLNLNNRNKLDLAHMSGTLDKLDHHIFVSYNEDNKSLLGQKSLETAKRHGSMPANDMADKYFENIFNGENADNNSLNHRNKENSKKMDMTPANNSILAEQYQKATNKTPFQNQFINNDQHYQANIKIKHQKADQVNRPANNNSKYLTPEKRAKNENQEKPTPKTRIPQHKPIQIEQRLSEQHDIISTTKNPASKANDSM
jgi:hypothetical protein